jgi:hypothetical protein
MTVLRIDRADVTSPCKVMDVIALDLTFKGSSTPNAFKSHCSGLN